MTGLRFLYKAELMISRHCATVGNIKGINFKKSVNGFPISSSLIIWCCLSVSLTLNSEDVTLKISGPAGSLTLTPFLPTAGTFDPCQQALL